MGLNDTQPKEQKENMLYYRIQISYKELFGYITGFVY